MDFNKNDMMLISVVIPVYNSAESIQEVVARCIKTLDQENVKFEIILVDDHSQDDSLKKIFELQRSHKRITALHLESNQGQQAALKHGIIISKGDYIVTIDDDLEQFPEDIPLLISEIRKGYQTVYGIAHKKVPLHRKAGSKAVDLFFWLCMDKPVNVRVSSFRIMARDVADQIRIDETDFVYLSAIILKYTKNIGNIRVRHQNRKYGKSNYSLQKLIRLFVELFVHYRLSAGNRPSYGKGERLRS